MVCILANSFALAFWDYTNKDEKNNEIISWFNWIISILMTIEALLKVVAMGFYQSRYSYLRDSWNKLDALFVLSFLVLIFLEFILKMHTKGYWKYFRLLLTLRPIKTITYIPSLKQLVGALITSLPELLNVSIFFLFIFILFGIMGLQ